jgi:hypothetical protein
MMHSLLEVPFNLSKVRAMILRPSQDTESTVIGSDFGLSINLKVGSLIQRGAWFDLDARQITIRLSRSLFSSRLDRKSALVG